MTCLYPLPALLALALALAVPATAEEFESRDSPAAAEQCKTVEEAKDGEGDWVVRTCEGRAGYLVLLNEDDLRTTISVGTSITRAKNEPAASQSFGPFNSAADTIEWRGLTGAKPFAIIQRWTLADIEHEDKEGRPAGVDLLIVTRLPPGPVCHVAYVDAQANEDAVALARTAADDSARKFRCGADQVLVVGKPGRAIALARH